jgi:hypothetical protein
MREQRRGIRWEARECLPKVRLFPDRRSAARRIRKRNRCVYAELRQVIPKIGFFFEENLLNY